MLLKLQLTLNRSYTFYYLICYPLIYLLFKLLTITNLKYSRQLLCQYLNWYYVCLLKFTITLTKLLHCIVCQMHINLIKVLIIYLILFTTCTHITLRKLKHSSVMRYQHPHSNVKFSFPEKDRRLYVLLHNKRLCFQTLARRST